MNPQAAQQYLRTKVLTATPEQLQLMLYDGAIRFGQQARVALAGQNYELSYQLICRVQRILAELTASLKHDLAPDLCGKLAALYNYAYRRLIDANLDHQVEPLDDAMKVLEYQRQTWALLLEQLGRQKAAVAATKLDLPAPSERMEASISMQG
jgi:flagellar protein FliS